MGVRAMRNARIRLAAFTTSAITVCAIAATPAAAQHRGFGGGIGGGIGGGAPHAAPAAPAVPHFSAPAAPHFTAPVTPHFSAPVAPHFSAPQVAPRIVAPNPRVFSVPQTTPHVAPNVAPHVPPRLATPQIMRPAPEQSGRPSFRYVPPRNFAGPAQPGGPGTRNLTQPLRDRAATSAYARAVPNVRGPNQTLLGPTANRPFPALALRNPAFTNRVAGAGGRALAHATFQGAFAGRHWNAWRRHRFFPIVIGWTGPL